MAQVNEKSREKTCTLCQEEDQKNVAVTWCINCETFLCKDCDKYHGKIKASKDHHTTSVDSFNELPSFLTDITNNCRRHDKQFEAYCSIHAEACCIECIISLHNKCQGLRKLEEVLADFKSSAATYHVESDINYLIQNFDKVTTHLTRLLDAIDRQKREGIKHIEATKQSIILHLNKLVESLKDDVEEKHSLLQHEIKTSLGKIEGKKTELDQTRIDLNKMKDYATEIQMYEGLKIIERKISEKLQYFEKLQSEPTLNKKRLDVKLSPLLTKINGLATFGNASILTTENSILLDFHKAGQVNIKPFLDKNINEIKPTLLTRTEILNYSVSFSGCEILPNGQMLVVEKNRQCLLLYSKDGKFKRKVQFFDNCPYDITFIKENIVAVTDCVDKKISFVDINENRITTSYQVDCSCIGISCENDTVVVNTGNAGKIIFLDFNCKVTSTLQVKSYSIDICYWENKIYTSEQFDDSVSCYKDDGEHLWTHELDRRSEPRGLALDRFGVIYVACKNSNRVIAISKDGKTSVTILNNTDGLFKPVGISCDKKSSTLLVANCTSGSALLFKI